MSGRTLTWSEPVFGGLFGVARRDITPPIEIYARNWGAAEHDLAVGVHRPLLCTVLTIRGRQDETRQVLAAIDATWFRGPEGATLIRERVCAALGLKPESLMVALSHTHAGPSISPAECHKPGGSHIMPYVERVAEAIVDAAREAVAGETLCELRFAAGRCRLAVDRDLPDPMKDRLVCGFNPAGEPDDACMVGRVSRASDGVAIATIVNYACHPTTLGASNKLISPDFVGAMRETVEAATDGAPCLFLQGASGELAPRIQYSGDTTVADAHGRELGHAAVSALEGMLEHGTSLVMEGVVESGAPLAMWRVREGECPAGAVRAIELPVELPLKPSVRDETQILREMHATDDRAAKERLHRELLVARTVGAGGATSKRTVWIWKLGEVIFVGQSDEAYSHLQRNLREAFPHRCMVVMNVVNGWGGYICPANRYEQRVYQAQQSPYASGCLEMMIDHVRWAISELEHNDLAAEPVGAEQGFRER
ncbi:MAG: hypothetical protein J0L78_02395 [Planctomycetes bacterium]|nr:hypothetical protein [Planctomycetota bacterium]